MKRLILFLLVCLSCSEKSLAIGNYKKDSAYIAGKAKILGNKYTFVKYKEIDRELLKIFLVKKKDSSIVLELEDSFAYGNCNSNSYGVSSYKIENNKLIVWHYQKDDEHMDDRYHHYTSSTKKETYAIQKKGSIVRLKIEYGKNNVELDKYIRNVLEKKLSSLK